MTFVWGIPLAYAAIVTLLWAFQERLTFPAPRDPLPDPSSTIGAGERIALTMKDGTRLAGWYLPPAMTPATAPFPALLWFYGNGENIAAIWPILRDFRPPQAALLVVDYPGYGGSDGKTSEMGIYEAGELAYDALRQRREVDSSRIYAYGRSLGSAVATHIAASRNVAGLILESPFTSARAMAARHYKLVPQFLVRLRLDNLANIARVRSPILVFHGTSDLLVPIEMGQEIARAAGGPVEFVMIEGSGHNDTYDMGGKRYRQKLAAFVR
jgi:uncharacterized protein